MATPIRADLSDKLSADVPGHSLAGLHAPLDRCSVYHPGQVTLDREEKD